MAEETVERGLVTAGFDAVRQIGGEALVQVLLAQAGQGDLETGGASDRVPLEAYLRYRDTAIDFLRDSFCGTAFETGRILARILRREHGAQLASLLSSFGNAANKLPLIGQAAVLGARGNPGVVRASMRHPELLVITIEKCPECRGLKRETPFCNLNQGLITELAEGDLGLRVQTEETKCIAMGEKACEIQVKLAR